MPLRLSEITQAAAFLHFEWQTFFNWIAQTPAGAPLHYLTELPFALLAPDSKALLRIPTVACALGSVFLFFALSNVFLPLQHPILALVLFLFVPTHLMYATQARPYELGLFLFHCWQPLPSSRWRTQRSSPLCFMRCFCAPACLPSLPLICLPWVMPWRCSASLISRHTAARSGMP